MTLFASVVLLGGCTTQTSRTEPSPSIEPESFTTTSTALPSGSSATALPSQATTSTIVEARVDPEDNVIARDDRYIGGLSDCSERLGLARLPEGRRGVYRLCVSDDTSRYTLARVLPEGTDDQGVLDAFMAAPTEEEVAAGFVGVGWDVDYTLTRDGDVLVLDFAYDQPEITNLVAFPIGRSGLFTNLFSGGNASGISVLLDGVPTCLTMGLCVPEL